MTTSTKPSNECVIIIHGHGSGPVRMRRIEKALRARGFGVINWGYPSTRLGLTDIANRLIERVRAAEDSFARIHFVTHSMGGLVLRRMLALRPVQGMGRIVMIAPPNNGLQLARIYLKYPAVLKLMGPAAGELADTEHIKRVCALPDAEVMVIAGTRSFSIASINAWLSRGRIPVPGDGTVSVAETRLPNMTRFVEINDHHSHLVSNKDVISNVIDFLS